MKKLFFALAVLCAATLVSCKGDLFDTSVKLVGLDKTELSLLVGDTETLTPIIEPTNAKDQSVSWSSSEPSVASVKNGKVKALAAGHTIITVTTTDGGYKAICSVTVTEPDPWEYIPNMSCKIDDVTVKFKSAGLHYSSADRGYDILFLEDELKEFGGIFATPTCEWLSIDLHEMYLGEQSLDECLSNDDWSFYCMCNSFSYQGSPGDDGLGSGKMKLEIDKNNRTLYFAIDGHTRDGHTIQCRYVGPYIESPYYIVNF